MSELEFKMIPKTLTDMRVELISTGRGAESMSELEFTLLSKALTDTKVENEKLKQQVKNLQNALQEAMSQLEEAGLI